MVFRVLMAVVVTLTMTAGVRSQTPDELRPHVEYLASDDLEGRKPASEGMKAAVKYVVSECQKIGLAVNKQPVKVRDGKCENVIAVLTGLSDDRVVIGAHLDHIGIRWRTIYNGADDNASGCAGVLGLAKRFKNGPTPPCTIEFHFYTGEEQGFLGSSAYTRKPLAPIEKYKFMLDLDMIGRLKSVRGRLIGSSAFPFDAVLDKLYGKYDFAGRITWAENTNDSDHAPWWRAGVPAVILHTGLHKDYHEPGDDANKIDYEGMSRVCGYAADMMQAIMLEINPVIVAPTDPVVPPVLY